MNCPLVSVIIPTYNGSRFIRETIQSVLDQTYNNLEIMVVDDGSTDDTSLIVKSITDQRITYIQQKNAGVSPARNHGITVSKGDYIAFLDHDDVWLPCKLEKQLSLFEQNPKVALIYSDAFIINENNFIMGKYSHKIKFFRGRIFKEICEDYDLLLKCAAKYPIDYIDEPLAKYRVHGSNYSKNYETEINECIEIFDFWRNQKNINGYNINTLISNAITNTYYNALKNAIKRRKDYRGSIKYFFLFIYYWIKKYSFKNLANI